MCEHGMTDERFRYCRIGRHWGPRGADNISGRTGKMGCAKIGKLAVPWLAKIEAGSGRSLTHYARAMYAVYINVPHVHSA